MDGRVCSSLCGPKPHIELAGAVPLARSFQLDALLPEAEMRKTGYYSDFLLPQEDLRSGCGMALARSAEAVLAFGTLHPKSVRSALDADAMALLGGLAADATRAWALSRQSGLARIRNKIARGLSIAVIDTGGNALHLSAATEAALAEGHLLRFDSAGRVDAVVPVAVATLESMRLEILRSWPVLPPSCTISTDGKTGLHEWTLAPLDPETLGGTTVAMVLGLLRPAIMIAVRALPEDDVGAVVRRECSESIGGQIDLQVSDVQSVE